MTFHNEFSRIAVDAGTADQPLFPLIWTQEHNKLLFCSLIYSTETLPVQRE